MDGHLKIFAFAIALPVFANAANGQQVLQDPTRPPAEFYALDAMPSREPTLQSVFISGSRRSAIISGQSVGVGGKVGNAEVVAIRDQEVDLREGKEVKTLRVFPKLERAGAQKPSTPAKREQKK